MQPNETCVYKESYKITFIYNGIELIKDSIWTYQMSNNYPFPIHHLGEAILIPIGDGDKYISVRICSTCGKKEVELIY